MFLYQNAKQNHNIKTLNKPSKIWKGQIFWNESKKWKLHLRRG